MVNEIKFCPLCGSEDLESSLEYLERERKKLGLPIYGIPLGDNHCKECGCHFSVEYIK